MFQKNAAALLRHAMREKQQRIGRALRPESRRDGAAPEDGRIRMTETRIYVGLNDAETREQKFETEKYVNILRDVCRNYHAAFSVDIEQGGYYHEDGQYTEETSLVLVLIDAGRDTVREIAQDLRTFFRQESVLVTEHSVDGCFITE